MTASREVRELRDISAKAMELLKKLSKDPLMRTPQRKGDGSPVTPADLEISAFLTEKLKVFGVPVISEEDLPEDPNQVGPDYFLVDPLDGTKYFSRGEDEFAICIGWVKQGRPEVGVICDPTDSHIYWAERGIGAFQNDQRIDHPGPSGPLTVYSSGFHKGPHKDKIVQSLNIGKILEKGSALKFCDIAKGEVDLYLRMGPTSEWDTAAAQVLLEEAGCVLLEGYTLKAMAYGKKNLINRGIIACHASVKDQVIAMINEEQPTGFERRYDK